jgi:hypothetical protein
MMTRIVNYTLPILELNHFEDEEEIAEDFIDDLNLSNIVANIHADDSNLQQILFKRNLRKAFVLDITFKPNRGALGLNILSCIRQTDKESLIIVYSAHKEYKERCFELGADFFFQKESQNYEDHIGEIRRILNREILLAFNQLSLDTINDKQEEQNREEKKKIVDINGYVNEIIQPYIEVVIDELEKDKIIQKRVLFPYELFESAGITGEYMRFRYIVYRENNKIISEILPPDNDIRFSYNEDNLPDYLKRLKKIQENNFPNNHDRLD